MLNFLNVVFSSGRGGGGGEGVKLTSPLVIFKEELIQYQHNFIQ